MRFIKVMVRFQKQGTLSRAVILDLKLKQNPIPRSKYSYDVDVIGMPDLEALVKKRTRSKQRGSADATLT